MLWVINRAVASGWTGWTMSRGSPSKMNSKNNIGCPWVPEGLATPVVIYSNITVKIKMC